MLALRRQFEDPFEEEKARVGLRQIRQGSRSVSEYVSEFCQLAGVVQDWPEQMGPHWGAPPRDRKEPSWIQSGGTGSRGFIIAKVAKYSLVLGSLCHGDHTGYLLALQPI
uniref:Uncharacterized protein n=1 Tax=Sphaerodactylus townsendi TaxID=933632 RepID=A0ACB8FFD8_9SAUR